MIVQVKEGKLRGVENKSVLTGKQYCSFFGIPYAKPPINDLRFQPPIPAENWTGILDATDERNDCMQSDFLQGGKLIGSEDCLYINVHTPEPPSKINILKPTLVFIHGGGFFSGSGSQKMYSADYLINHDVVYVTLNYRLHAFGFLNLGVPSCTGNFGLKDQSLALRWIKENIEQFGGDSNNITIFGESAGSSSVHYQILSPKSKGLFHKAIMQSGTALSPWGLISNPIEMGFKLGRKLGFEGNDNEKLVQFLKQKSAVEICNGVLILHEDAQKCRFGGCNTLSFAPSIELIKENAFICEHPEKLSKTADPIPVIYGINDKEGLLILKASTEELGTKLQEEFGGVVKYNFKVDQSRVPEAAAKIRKYYFGDKTIKNDSLKEISNLFTDLYFWRLYDSFEFVSKSKFPMYVYEFTYDGSLNFFKKIVCDFTALNVTGAAHADDLGYLFYARQFPFVPEYDPNDVKVIENFCRLWTNFARTGNPTSDMTTVNWKPSTIDNPRYLHISSDLKMIDGKINEERFSFWKNLIDSINAEC